MGRRNCDALSPNETSNSAVMSQGFADEAVVVIKWRAVENMETCWRIKLVDSDKDVEAKGGTCKRCGELH